MNNISIEKLDPSGKAAWDAFVRTSGCGTLFHLTAWMDSVHQVFGHASHAFLAQKNGEVLGVLPAMQVKSRFFGHALVSVPYAVLGGAAATDKSAQQALIRQAEHTARELGVDYLEMRNPPPWPCVPSTESGSRADTDPAPVKDGWARKDLYVIFQKAILSTVAENLQAIPRKQRRMARLGSEKYDLTSRIGGLEELDAFYPIYARNVRDLGSPVFPKSFFRTLLQNFPDAFILSVWKEGIMVAGVLTFVFNEIIMPYYGGGNRDYQHFAINDFMYWELMQHGCRNGFKIFDFGRSKRGTGAYDFKRHWGFEPQPLPYEYYLVNSKSVPDVNPLNPRYQLMIAAWKRLPLTVTNRLGPMLVRGIP